MNDIKGIKQIISISLRAILCPIRAHTNPRQKATASQQPNINKKLAD